MLGFVVHWAAGSGVFIRRKLMGIPMSRKIFAGAVYSCSLLLAACNAGCGRVPSARPTTIFEAASKGNLGLVKSFAKKSPALVDAVDRATGHTLLELAITRNHLATVRWLLLHGANPNGEHGQPLFVAAWNLNLPAVLILVQAGANPDPTIGKRTRMLESPGRAGLPDYLLRERIILWYLRRQSARYRHETLIHRVSQRAGGG